MIQRLIASLLSQLLGLILQENRCVYFREGEEGESSSGEYPNRLDIFGPSPAKMRINEEGSPNRGTESWTTNNSYGSSTDTLVRASRRFDLPTA